MPSRTPCLAAPYAYPHPGQVREEADSEEVSRERSAKVKTDPNPNRSPNLNQ